MLVDEAEIIVKGGHGGAGKVSFYPPPMKGPDGGNGGKGGDVYIKVTTDLMALSPFTSKRLIVAQKGENGSSNRKFGKDGKDLEILMPKGTTLTDKNTGETIELIEAGQKVVVAKGGLGGRGNFEFKSSKNTTPSYAQPGLEGEERHFKVELKLIADFGLIGLPNAGKSSLLNELTAANAKTAEYPFTTLEPNLGVLEGKIIADIPGLIEGASSGKGLGTKFLKHIEKVSILLHCLSSQSQDPKKDYQIVNNELLAYNLKLGEKKEVLLLTKSDLISGKELKEKIQQLKPLKKDVFPVSIHDWEQLEGFKKNLLKMSGNPS